MQNIEFAADKENPSESRENLVKEMVDKVLADIEYWKPDFDRMRANRRFARGLQWPGTERKDLMDPDRPYVENITMRHLKQRTAATYARAPKFVWRKTKKLYSQIWDGTAGMLQTATMQMQADPANSLLAQQILQEAMTFAQENRNLDRMGETLALAYEYSLREQTQPTKRMMKRTVLQSGTCGVGYVKQTFQRTMQTEPGVERQINDAKSQLDAITRIMQEVGEGEIDENDPEMERLNLLIRQLEAAPQILLREGLILEYPDPLNIVPDQDLIFLPGFYGCTYVTEVYHMTKKKIMETYGVDLGEKYRPYTSDDPKNLMGNRVSYTRGSGKPEKADCACVFEIYDKADGMIYTVCDGYDDFLREPEQPDPWTERFWPWFVFAPNALDDPDHPFPASDVELMDTMQMEINRAGEGLRDHRYAARPGHVVAGNLSDEDQKRIGGRAAHSVVPIQGLGPEGDIKKMLQAFPTSPIDPNLYDTSPAFQGVLRSVGTQEANLGPTSGATATESSIAQSSRQNSDDSTIDELDDLLTEMARAGGQILLMNLTEQTVKEIVGPGALWPSASKEEVARELFLECEAGSSGRKNQAHEIQVRTQMYPLMFQIAGLSQERMAKDMLNVMDNRISFEEFVDVGALSVVAMNAQKQAAQGGIGTPADPAAQGGEGAGNAPTPEPPGQQGPNGNVPPPAMAAPA